MEMELREGMREKWNEREARLSRPSNTPGGREVRLLFEREMKGEIEDEVMVEEREMRERTKIVQSIKHTRFK